MKIYTKTGDNGTTGLFAGPRVAKDHPRIAAYGCVDELNALLGVVAATLERDSGGHRETAESNEIQVLIQAVQSDLFSIGAELATPAPQQSEMCLLTEQRVEHLEQWIDTVDDRLEPLRSFVLPAGSLGSTMLHLARTVCRRAEREVVHLSREVDVHDCTLIIVYLNRLSDLLFVLARHHNLLAGIADVPWERPS